jgi:hypothetical protein
VRKVTKPSEDETPNIRPTICTNSVRIVSEQGQNRVRTGLE